MGYDEPDFTRNPHTDKRGLTEQKAIFADNVLRVGKDAAAAMAYPDATDKSQGEIASRNMSDPVILHSISKLADLRGVKREDCLDAIKKGLSEANPKAYLHAAELGLKIHKEIGDTKTVVAVPVSKEQFLELCGQFWATKPK